MIEFSIPPSLITALIVSVFIPALVSLVTTKVTNTSVKGLLLAGLSLATGLLTELGEALVSGTTYDIGVGILNGVLALAAAQGSYSSVWKPTGAAKAITNVGVTPSTDDPSKY